MLPSHASESPRARPSRKTMSCATMGSVIWLVVSLVVVLLGISYLRKPTDLRHMSCTGAEGSCSYIIDTVDDGREVFKDLTMVKAEAVRVRRGRAVEIKNMRRKSARKLGYSYQLIARDANDKVHKFVMSYGSIGRSTSKEEVDKVMAYVKGTDETLESLQSSGVSAVGILLVIYGGFSLLFSLILGQFSEPPEPRKRLAPPKRSQPRHVSSKRMS